MEEKKEKLIQAVNLAYLTASFNGGNNVAKYRFAEGENYAPDYYSEGRYHFEIKTTNRSHIMIYINGGGASFSIQIETSNTKENWYDKTFKIEDILTNDTLYEKAMKWLEEPLNRYRFKADDIISKKAYNLKPANSNVALQIEEFIYKFAFALSKGIPGKSYVTPSLGLSGIEPVTFSYSPGNWNDRQNPFAVYYNGSFTKAFENSVMPGGVEVKECGLNDILSGVDLNAIAKIKLETMPNIEEEPMLLQFIRQGLPEYFANFTKGLNETATVYDVAEVINFRVKNDYCIFYDKEFVYDPETNFDEETRQEIARIDEMLGDRGTVLERYKSYSVKKDKVKKYY